MIKLKNKYTGEIVYTENPNDISERDGIKFIRVYNADNLYRSFLVNREAFDII